MTDSNDNPSGDDHASQFEENVYREIHEWGSSASLSGTVVAALANFKGVESAEMKPLYEYIDPDALEALFDPTRDGFRTDGRVSFSIDDSQVAIHSHGEFAVVSIRTNPSKCIDCRSIVDDATFGSALQTLVQMAAQNDVGVSGGWRVESPSNEFPDWEVVITELAKRPDETDPSAK